MKLTETLLAVRISPQTPAAIAETLLIPALAIALGVWLNPADPLLAQGEYPWLWLAPILLALRYGAVSGIIGAVLMGAGWYGLKHYGMAEEGWTRMQVLGGLITVMLCGEFSSAWRNRLRNAETSRDYLEQRLTALTRQHYLLRLSHDRLEQDLIARPVSLRDALTTLRRLGIERNRTARLPGATVLLRLLAEHCQLERAVLLPCRPDGEPIGEPVARIGGDFPVDLHDPLVHFAIDKQRLSHVAQRGSSTPADSSQYLVVAPVRDFLHRARALLIVERMPFFALHEEALQSLDLLLGYYADSLAADEAAEPIMEAIPNCSADFAFELARLCRISRDQGLLSVMVALSFTPKEGLSELPSQVRRSQRTLEVSCVLAGTGRTVLLTLIPLANDTVVEGYLARIQALLQERWGSNLEEAGVQTQVFRLEGQMPIDLMQTVLRAAHVDDDPSSVRAAA